MAKKRKRLKHLPATIEDAPLYLRARLAAIAEMRRILDMWRGHLDGLDSLGGYRATLDDIGSHVDDCEWAIDRHLAGKLPDLDGYLVGIRHDEAAFPFSPECSTEPAPEWADDLLSDASELLERLMAPVLELAIAFNDVMDGSRDELPTAS